MFIHSADAVQLCLFCFNPVNVNYSQKTKLYLSLYSKIKMYMHTCCHRLYLFMFSVCSFHRYYSEMLPFLLWSQLLVIKKWSDFIKFYFVPVLIIIFCVFIVKKFSLLTRSVSLTNYAWSFHPTSTCTRSRYRSPSVEWLIFQVVLASVAFSYQTHKEAILQSICPRGL